MPSLTVEEEAPCSTSTTFTLVAKVGLIRAAVQLKDAVKQRRIFVQHACTVLQEQQDFKHEAYLSSLLQKW
jgi:hypothetical protein